MDEVGIIGAGIVGLSTAYALSERGVSVTVYERGVPGNAQSGGESRIFRHVHEDARLVAFARQALDAWREWEEHFECELLRTDGVVVIGRAAESRLALLNEVEGVRARAIDGSELADRLPLLSEWEGPAMLDEDGGVIRTRAAIEALCQALRDRLVFEEVLSLRHTASETIELRAGGVLREHERVVVCAGRGTAALARGVGLALPVHHAAHVRLSFAVRGEPPDRLACLLDRSGAFGEGGAYADPLPGNGAYAVGLDDTPANEDGSLVDSDGLAALAERITEYVRGALPGLDPRPLEPRHCSVAGLPWSADGIAVWSASGLVVLAGNNLFKHAPVLGRVLASAAIGEGLPASFRPEAKLGAETVPATGG